MVTPGSTIDFHQLVDGDTLAHRIADLWNEWGNAFRAKWVEEQKEKRNYVFATDTRTTSNNKLPWSNSTTTPKLCQIRDNLAANYQSALFPNSDWLKWEGDTEQDQEKARVIQAYMKNKLSQDKFEDKVLELIFDFIDGNCFAKAEYVAEYVEVDGELIPKYIGPRIVRISPYDIAFNPTANDFRTTPKIVKSIVSLGDIKKAIKDDPAGNENLSGIFDKMRSNRMVVRQSDAEIHKSEGYVADGFSNITNYYETDYVELLTFYGSYYDSVNDELIDNEEIVVVDRAYVVSRKKIPSWLGSDGIHHVGWRLRPDNLYAQGALDNLVGLQYRADHLENLKADAFDQIAYPQKKIVGQVEEFSNSPGSDIYVGDDGDVVYLTPPDATLQADFQIDRIFNLMEEMAGAPRQAMGIRTPGEKTAFEVDSLNNASDRIFKSKTSYYESNFLEHLLNDMLEMSVRNMKDSEIIRTIDDSTGVEIFKTITKEDIKARGNLRPKGARHFAERNTRLQNLNQFALIKAQDPTVAAHVSGKKFARLMAEELGEPELFGDNVTVYEQIETQKAAQEAMVDAEEESEMANEMGL